MPKIFRQKNPKPGVKQDLRNKKFGRLLVLSGDKRDKRVRVIWDCICDCGNYTIAVTHDLKSGKKTSCGCGRNLKGKLNKSWKGYEEISGHYWSAVKHGAKSRNLDIQIELKDCWEQYLIQNKKCALSGLEITFPTEQCKRVYNLNNHRNSGTASLDRKDSSKGYTKENIQWVHKDINLMKNYFDEDYFIKICKLIVSNMEKNNDKH